MTKLKAQPPQDPETLSPLDPREENGQLGPEHAARSGLVAVGPIEEDPDWIDSARAKEQAEVLPLRGMAGVAQALRLEEFPIEKANIDYSVGDVLVEDGEGGWIEVNRLTDALRQDTFPTLEAAMAALHAARDDLLRQRRAA